MLALINLVCNKGAVLFENKYMAFGESLDLLELPVLTRDNGHRCTIGICNQIPRKIRIPEGPESSNVASDWYYF